MPAKKRSKKVVVESADEEEDAAPNGEASTSAPKEKPVLDDQDHATVRRSACSVQPASTYIFDEQKSDTEMSVIDDEPPKRRRKKGTKKDEVGRRYMHTRNHE